MKPSKTVMLVAFPDHGVWHGIIQGIRAYTAKHHPWLLRFTSPLALPKTMRDWGRVDGLIGHLPDDRIVKRALRDGIRLVSTVNDHPERGLPLVCQDDYAIGRLAAEEFLQRGFRQFGSLLSAPFAFARNRNSGFVDRIRQAGFDCRVYRQSRSPMMYYHNVYEAFDKALIPWIRSLPRPVAVFTGGDYLAYQFVNACEFAAVAVPEEVAVIGVDNDEVCCTLSHPPLSSIYTPGQTIGHRAAELLHRLLRGRPPPSKPILVPPSRVVVRRSSNILALDDPLVATTLRHIREHAHEGMSVKQLEDMAGGVSIRTLHRRYMKLLGYGPGEAAIRARLERAKDLLVTTRLSTEEIARQCGWGNGRTLTTLFHRRTGQTPGAFRSRH